MRNQIQMLKKHRKNHSYWLIKTRRTYTAQEVSDLLGVHVRTVRSWRKFGLESLSGSQTPLLFHGYELKRFLQDRRRRGRCHLAPGQFYCLRCRDAREPMGGRIQSTATGKALGYSKEQVILKGECSVCGAKMVRFGSQERRPSHSLGSNAVAGSNTVISEQLGPFQCDPERSKECY